MRGVNLNVWKLVVGPLAVLGFFAASCSSSSPAYCDQRQATENSYNSLVQTNVVSEGTSVLKTRFQTFRDDLASLKSAASSQFSSQIDGVQASVDNLQSVINNADTAGASATASQLSSGLQNLKSSTQTLFTAVDDACSN